MNLTRINIHRQKGDYTPGGKIGRMPPGYLWRHQAGSPGFAYPA